MTLVLPSRRTVLAGATALLAAPSIVRGQAKPKVTYAYLLDPAYDAVVWAIRNGKVRSDLIDVDATGMNIPTLLQVTATRQYDVVMTAVIGVPAALSRGLDLRILSAALHASANGEGGGVWVGKDSALKDPKDLKGKTLGSYGLRSTGYMFVREALSKKFGLNMALEGGDVRQVEIAAPNLPASLSTSRVDAATLIHSQAFRARTSGEYVNICETGTILNEIHGRLVSAVNVGYADRLATRAAEFREFNRMLKASIDYALANRREVFSSVGTQANIDPSFFEWWFDRTTDVPAIFGPAQAQAVTRAWEIGLGFGMIQSAPTVDSVTWDQTLRG